MPRSLPGIGSLVFSETQHVVRGPCDVGHDSQLFYSDIFLAEIPFWEKSGSHPKIWAKMILANQISGFLNQPYL